MTRRKMENPLFYDIVLQNMVKCWYLNTQPNRSYLSRSVFCIVTAGYLSGPL